MAKQKYYWFSFSGKNKALGVVLTESSDIESAFTKIAALDLLPPQEDVIDIAAYEVSEAEVKLDVFHTPEDMTVLGYETIAETIKVNN
tara:strand:- start:5599 stop:5862 length:264 start_codon:yes stop_codon:yes gene_type:complete